MRNIRQRNHLEYFVASTTGTSNLYFPPRQDSADNGRMRSGNNRSVPNDNPDNLCLPRYPG